VAGRFAIGWREAAGSLAQYESWVSVLKGCVLVACVMVFKQGIVGELASRMRTRI